MKRELIYAPLVGRRLQRIEEGINGELYFHFTPGTVIVIGAHVSHQYVVHPATQPPLVIPAK
jgi:hypothetical protein